VSLLDVTKLNPFGGEIDGVDIAKTIRRAASSPVQFLARAGLVKKNQSFGFAAVHPQTPWDLWDNPHEFTWFVLGWGPDRNRYIANAVRKLRPTLREGRDTLEMRIKAPKLFRDIVESEDGHGGFPWGDFPWGGGTLVRVGDLTIPCAVSALREVEDDPIAKLLGGLTGAVMLKERNPDEFAQ
jgi:hypothetical protein